MGSRNLDRLAMWQWRARCETVAAMTEARWKVIGRCSLCRAGWPVDLTKVARLKGAATSLWNRRQACANPDCAGEISFEAQIPGLYGFRALDAPDPATVLRRETLGERAAKAKRDDRDGV